MELNTRTPVPEWGGQPVTVMAEDPVYLADDGWKFFRPRQESFYVDSHGGGPAVAARAAYPDGLYAELRTNKGSIVLQLEFERAPMTVANFVGLAEGHRREQGAPGRRAVLRRHGVSPRGARARHPGRACRWPARRRRATHSRTKSCPALSHGRAGMLGMANSGPHTNTSQFYITLGDRSYLDGNYTLFGRCPRGPGRRERRRPGRLDGPRANRAGRGEGAGVQERQRDVPRDRGRRRGEGQGGRREEGARRGGDHQEEVAGARRRPRGARSSSRDARRARPGRARRATRFACATRGACWTAGRSPAPPTRAGRCRARGRGIRVHRRQDPRHPGAGRSARRDGAPASAAASSSRDRPPTAAAGTLAGEAGGEALRDRPDTTIVYEVEVVAVR